MTYLRNRYLKLPNRSYSLVNPESFPKSKIIKFNQSLASELGLDFDDVSEESLSMFFSGQKMIPGAKPLALAYAAHQFGRFVPQLGDGRAHILGDISGFDIQLKGSGRTKFSRQGDGRSELGPVIREFILSEAMFALNIETTRALAAVATNEEVYRDGAQPGGIFTRVAPSHIRVGTFQYYASRTDIDGLEALLRLSVDIHYPVLKDLCLEEMALLFLEHVGESQAKLVASWLGVGFIHGVMNTDNFSVGGFTIDYGPCAFMDEYTADKTFSSIDRGGRYSYSNQPNIALWNLLRLGECLLPLIDSDIPKAIKKVENIFEKISPIYERYKWITFAKKFGIDEPVESDIKLMKDFLKYLEDNKLDFTISFRSLPNLRLGDFNNFVETEELKDFIEKWKLRVPELPNLDQFNPWLIPRNHQIQRAIDGAYAADYSYFNRLLEAYSEPFVFREEFVDLALAPKEEEKIVKTFCGT